MSRFVPADIDTAANLPADVAYTDVNNTFTVAQTLSGAITGALLQVNNSSTIGAGVLIGSTSVASAGAGKIAPALALTQTTPATANYGLVSIGGGAWDGAAAGHFVGDANGTKIAVNATSGFTGKLLDLQVNGTSKIWIGNTGNILLTNIVQLSDSGFNFSGTTSVLSRNNSTGAITFQLQNVSGATYSTISGHASAIPQIVKGAVSQSADLQQWQNSSGTVLAKVDASGNFYFATTIASTGGGSSLSVNNNAIQATAAAGSITPFVVRGAASQSVDLQQWQNSTGTVLASIAQTGALTVGSVGVVKSPSFIPSTFQATMLFGDGGAITTTGQITHTPKDATSIPYIVKGFASQSASLQEWQDSTGAVLAKIDSSGSLVMTAIATQIRAVQIVDTSNNGSYIQMQSADSGIRFSARNASNNVAVCRGVSSQVGDLQQWQNSSATVLAKVDATGAFNDSTGVGSGARLSNYYCYS